MIRLIRFTLFILYNYYKEGKGTKHTPYLSAVLSFILLLFMNTITALDVLGIGAGNIIPWNPNDPTWLQYLEALVLFWLPGYLIMSFLFKKVDIVVLKYDENTIRRGNITLFVYFVLSFIMMAIFAKL